MEYLDSLNEPQREGVINTDGPCMLIAGAGSGKTRVLTYRIAYLIQNKGIDPFNIMALTFTNKASREMRERIEKVVGSDARNLWMGTFHSVFARILRAEAHHIGYPNNFTIYDVDDSKSLIRSIVKEMGLDEHAYKANTVYNRISAAKNRLIGWQDYLGNAELMGDDAANMRPELGNIFKNYSLRCFKSGAMDFDDLLFNTDKLFKEHLEVLNKYQHRIQYVLVDEFQDTNLCQYFIIRKLAS
ncbi:MAG: UvrD-helicase domain-containing protein, partial [Bacteroidota bacterium]|nr:UvrD-helicase domain-containing protein [Bacteroidota bacterium]